MRFGFIVCSLLVLAACSNVPKNIKNPPVNDVQLNQVIVDKQASQGETVRWGGEIIAIENTNDHSMIQVVQFPLNHYGKPQKSRNSQGRFIARSTEFFDPAVYEEGTLITFSGNASGETTTRNVDEKQIIMPIIDVTESYRWQQYDSRSTTYYRDPFFYPYHSFYYNRWYGHPWYGPRFGYRYYYH
ncbi:MAG: Slp family lipoprotein [Reinekea sp.]|nr:Slp family lipoprotein [Reinekea sp.]